MARNKRSTIFTFVKGLVIFTSLLFAFYGLGNWQAVRSQVAYSIQPPATLPPVQSPAPVQESRILIAKIGVNAPLQWDIPADQTEAYLDKGPTHLQGSAKPGEKGNLFITGHSSDYSWKRDPYAAVFALLPKLSKGDQITIQDQGKQYVYQVRTTLVVKPTQVEVADPTPTATLTMITCYPIGTTLNRYVVQADFVGVQP